MRRLTSPTALLLAVENVPATGHAPHGSPAACSASSGDSPSMPHWPADGSAFAVETPASSANSDDLLPFIDPLLKTSDALQPTVLLPGAARLG